MAKQIRIFAFGGNEVSPVGLTDENGKPIIPDIAMQWKRTAETCKIFHRSLRHSQMIATCLHMEMVRK